MDMTQSIVPKSDQLNADDLMTGSITVTVEKVSAGSAEQPVDVHLREFPGRAFRPSKSMRRVMVAAWGAETNEYTGRSMTLYRDPNIRFGRDEVGGIRISHMSHIDKSLKIALTVSRGKREAFIVEPIASAANKATPDIDAVTPEQMKLIGGLFGKLGISQSVNQLAYASDAIGRELKDATQLTASEADTLLLSLEKELTPVPESVPVATEPQVEGIGELTWE